MTKARRIYSEEYKIDAIRLVTQQGMSHREAARKLGIQESMLRRWQTQEAQGGEDPFPGKGKRPPRDAELAKLLEENRRLRMETDILKKAAAFFANPPSGDF